MTREEAIKGFEDMKKGLYPFYPDEYFDMAIKALEQEPTDKNFTIINDLEELRTMINKFAESYETRLKADMVALLEEIDLEMSEQSFGIQTEPWEVVEKLRKKIIQQKINALKAEK